MDTITSLAGSVNDLRKLVESLATENGNLRLELRSSTSRSEGSISKLQGSMSQLQQDNDELREEIKTKASDLAILQQNCGVMFRKFGELPLELRHMIWKLACQAPQIHVLQDGCVSRSQIRSIVNTSNDARAAANSLQLDYFLLHSHVNFFTIPGTIKNHFNLAVDTFWIAQYNSGYVGFPEQLEWKCGKCCRDDLSLDHGRSRHEHLVFHDDPMSYPILVHRLAIDIETWRHGSAKYHARHLRRYGVQELLLVVGNSISLARERNLTFVTPANIPQFTLNGMEDFGIRAQSCRRATWDLMAKKVVEFLVEIKQGQLEIRKIIKANPDVDIGEIDDDDGHFLALCDWQIPTVRFVEAKKAKSQSLLSAPAAKFSAGLEAGDSDEE